MNNKKKKKQNGFTIVELVIVIAVIGILAAVLIPTFSNLVKKSKQSADQQLVYHINEAVVANEVDNLAKGKSGTEATMYDTLKKLESDYGFTVEKMTPRSGNDIVWDSTTNRFALVAKDNKVVYTDPNRPSEMANKAQMWRITEAGETLGDGYSHYLTAGWSGVVPTVSTGLDVGENDDITSVNYARTTTTEVPTQTVDIRTNGGTLTVNAPADTVNHYGEVENLDIIAVKDTSYHEFGKVGYTNIAKGRLVVEESAEIDGIYLVANDSGNFNGIKLAVVGDAKLPPLARADVPLAENESKLVVELQTLISSDSIDANPEYVWITGTGSGAEVAISSSSTNVAETVAIPSAVATAVSATVEESATPVSDNSVARVNAVGYSTLESAFENAKNGSTILLLKDTSVDSIVTIQEETNLILNLNGHIIKNNVTGDQFITYHMYSMWPETYGTANAAGRPFVLLDGSSLTIDANGGGMEIPASNTKSYGFFRVYDATLVINGGTYTGSTDNGTFIHMKAYSCGEVTLNNVIASTNYRFLASDSQVYGIVNVIGGTYNQSNDGLSTPQGTIPAFWICMSRATFEDTSITSYWGECVCVNSSYYGGPDSDNNIESFFKGNNTFTVLTNNTIQSWNCCAIGIESGAVVNIEDGTYNGYKYGVYIFTSNGRLNVSGGAFTGLTAALRVDHNDNNYHPSTNPTMVPGIVVTGGTFNGPLIQGNETDFIITGGTFSADPTNYVDVENYVINGEGPYTVSAK